MRRGSEVSELCVRDDHGRCPHWVSGRIAGVWRRRPVRTMALCPCSCHAACPLSGEPTVLQETWVRDCRCPGAEAVRAPFSRTPEEREELRQILGEVDFSDHPDAVEIESRLRTVFEEHGQAPPPRVAAWSRVLASSALPRVTHDPHAGYRAVGVVTASATALTAAAVVSTGWRRFAFGVAAGAAWLLSGYAITLVTTVAHISSEAEAQRHAQDLPSC